MFRFVAFFRCWQSFRVVTASLLSRSRSGHFSHLAAEKLGSFLWYVFLRNWLLLSSLLRLQSRFAAFVEERA